MMSCTVRSVSTERYLLEYALERVRWSSLSLIPERKAYIAVCFDGKDVFVWLSGRNLEVYVLQRLDVIV